ncbi:hypothetical protein WN943_028536 [Citrus x changshan-huyou]
MLHDVVANFTHARLKVVGEGWLDPWATSENEGRVRNGSLLSGPSSVALALHYCKSLAHPTNPSINFACLNMFLR